LVFDLKRVIDEERRKGDEREGENGRIEFC